MFDPLSLGLLAASAFMKWQANEDAADKRESYRRSMEQYQRSKARETQAATEALIEKQTPKARSDELQQITDSREQSLRDTVGAAQAFDASPIAGKLSSDYRSADESNAARIAERTRRAIQQLAIMGSPAEQQQANAIRQGRAAGVVDAANRASENVRNGYMTDISNVRPDPLMSTLGDVGMGIGTAMAGAPDVGGALEVTPGIGDPEWGLISPIKTVNPPQSIATRMAGAIKSLGSPSNSIWGGNR